jgi:hypothetical protein
MKDTVEPIVALIRSSLFAPEQDDDSTDRDKVPAPFLTITSQSGTGESELAQRLTRTLNRLDPADRPWHSFDRDLIEAIADDREIARSVAVPLEDQPHPWLRDVFADLFLHGLEKEEPVAYRAVAATIASMARVGRVVILGRGGAFVTQDMPGGVHVYLVAPEDYRSDQLARRHGLTLAAARKRVRELDANRQAFHHRRWPHKPLVPEAFTVTLNVAKLTLDQRVDMLLPLIPLKTSRDAGDASKEATSLQQHLSE